ncbi:hypothetical protein PRMUPPPA20_19500 [Xylanibacter ruminicola]|uniref:L,D-transpeptidase catalytic domain n=2 Tax=Xylanibacter ruminicola TaxID=839 RepID=A0AA37I8D2_XYLRU|nr:hypothetical protein PRMUPPPA20_19500 [Xylanibacter ruminicola]
MGVSADADSVLAYLRREVPRNGLDTTAFFVPEIAKDLEIVHQLLFDSVGMSINEVLPRLNAHLSKAYIRYATGQRYGFMKPRVFNHMDPKVGNPGIFARVFDYDPALPDTSVAAKKMTESDRLAFLVSSAPDTYIYKALLREMDKTTNADKRHQLAVNMERCRWQIEHPKDVKRQILVNIPAQQLWAIDVDSVLDMRICCGAVPTKTPLLHSAISYMQVNPEWVIPQNIVKTEVVHHAGDSAYFARNRYSVIDKESGDTLNVASVGANALLSGKLRISQKGGVGNSLGRIVFRFQNDFSIYLHDTNNRSAFQRDRRTLSHGCVRVQKPFELASFLLSDVDEWTLESLRISMDIPPVTDRGREWLHKHADAPHPYRLISYHAVKPHVPLYILYYTTFPNPKTGAIDYWPDLYGFDKVISKELKWISEGSSSR